MADLEHIAYGRANDPVMMATKAMQTLKELSDRLLLLLLMCAGILIWEWLAAMNWVNPLFFPAPSTIAASFFHELLSGDLVLNLLVTLRRAGIGLFLGCTSGLAMGLLLGWSTRLRRLLDPIIGALYPLPKLALFPLFLIIFGLGEAPRIVLISLSAFFPILINTLAGVRQINLEYFEIAQSYGANRRLSLRRVVIPGALPSVLSGLRLAVGNALITTIAVELLNADTGLGAQIWWAWETLRTEVMYVTIFLVALLGIGSHYFLEYLAYRMIPWQTDRGDTVSVNPIPEI
jgi:ABC-type nitrate/sulfonate/bicarbonate transport system permease component